MAADLKSMISLIGRMDDHCQRSLEAASKLAVQRTHYNLEIEHWLLALCAGSGDDVSAILQHYAVDRGRLEADLNRVIDRMRTGSGMAARMSPDVITLTREAWLLASIEHGLSRLRSGHILWALLSDDALARRAREGSAEWSKIPLSLLARDILQIIGASAEAALPSAAPGATLGALASGSPLEQFTYDLTARARAGKIDPILGRDTEIRQTIDILTRRRQNNPILTGEAGVGKTAVVEGLALKIAAGEVPEAMRNVTLRTLDLALLQAGASMKGEFEQRLKAVIDAVKASPSPIIIFIDEAHTLIGAGGAAGQNDAANLLKPALARGELRTVAATTWAEYKKYFEKDAALTRRFQVVKVEEPSEAIAIAMIRGLTGTLEAHHKTRILDEAISEAVRLSARFIPSRQLPDKAISLIDTACARVAMSQASIPAPIEDRQRRLEMIATEQDILRRETATGADHAVRTAELAAEAASLQEALAALQSRFVEETKLAGEIAALRSQVEALADAPAALRDEFASLTTALKTLQGDAPLIFPVVDGQAVAEIVANWTGIPAGRMRSSEIQSVLTLQEQMSARIVGQPHALAAVAQAIQTSRARLTDPRKPIAVFLMVGTSGTGKTETALTLANLLYGGEQNLTTINMTEFKEEHKVSLLMGSPPGYVGYGEGGILTEAVRRRPYSVILLDEMEKAHPGVQDVFFQVFDKGNMKDGEGRDIDFKNTVLIMTSNAGTDLIANLFADPETAPDAAALAEALRPELMKYFKPAFLGRVTVIPYFPLSEEIIKQIVTLQLDKICRRVREAYKADFTFTTELVEVIAARCKESSSGARNVENILARSLLPELSAALLNALAEGRQVASVAVEINPHGAFTYQLT